MKRLPVIFATIFFTSSLLAQTNESDAGLYNWKGSKTSFQEGYVVLKSGKKLEGEISLKGSADAVTTISYNGEGKEINFPPAAISAYGLIGATSSSNPESASPSPSKKGLTCDVPEDLFVWKDMGVQMDKQIDATQSRQGYVILKNGSRIEGELKLKKIDKVLSQFIIKDANKKKHKLATAQIANYGLLLTVSELTKGGDKTYKDQARNFHEGTIVMADGSEKKGVIAFRNKTPINPDRPKVGYKYMGLYYAASKDELVTTFKNEEVKEISKNGVNYFKHAGGFVDENGMDNAKFKDKTKMMQPGFVILKDGSKKEGKVALDKKGTFYAQGLRFQGADGKITSYTAAEVKGGSQTFNETENGFTNINDQVVACHTDGETFIVYRNADPKTINEKKTGTARALFELSTTGISSFVIADDARKNDYSTNLDSLIQVSSANELKEIRNLFVSIQGYKSSDELQEKSNNETAKKYDSALGLAIKGKEDSQKIVIYNEEYIIKNKKENVRAIVNKQNYKEKMEPVLMGCYTYLSLDKKEQKEMLKWENIDKASKMIGECY